MFPFHLSGIQATKISQVSQVALEAKEKQNRFCKGEVVLFQGIVATLFLLDLRHMLIQNEKKFQSSILSPTFSFSLFSFPLPPILCRALASLLPSRLRRPLPRTSPTT